MKIPDGEMRVNAVHYWNEEQHNGGMPGMKISDPLPPSARRFWVDVTLHPTSASGIRYVPEAFTVTDESLPAVAPRWWMDGVELVRPGAQATVQLLYQVPKRQGDVFLQLGDSRPVRIPGPAGSGERGH